jgi:hypothetical protein
MSNTSPLFTRADYMAKRCTHREYFAQFVTPAVRATVARVIGIDAIRNSKDPHFNDIPMKQWDSIWLCKTSTRGLYISPPASVAALLKQANEGNSASTGTCILKEAARQLLESEMAAN